MKWFVPGFVFAYACAFCQVTVALADAPYSVAVGATPTAQQPTTPPPSPAPTLIPLGPEFVATPTSNPPIVITPAKPSYDPRESAKICAALQRQLRQYQKDLQQIREEIARISEQVRALGKIQKPEWAREAAQRAISNLVERWSHLSTEREWLKGAIDDIHHEAAVLRCNGR